MKRRSGKLDHTPKRRFAALEAVCKILPAGRSRVAERGVREGILTIISGKEEASCDLPAVVAAE